MICNACKGTGYRTGARDCFTPRSGYVYAQADYPQLELYTLAQCCVSYFTESKLADALNSGLDPHLQVASLIVKVSYDEAKIALKDKTHALHSKIKEARGAGKVANFGFPGGLGTKSLISYAKKGYGVSLTVKEANDLREFWFSAWPEMAKYFARIDKLPENKAIETLFTKRFRGRASYCAQCNNGFQALGADCAKRAGCLIARACYAEEDSPLFNSRIVAFIHDEFILEVPYSPAREGVDLQASAAAWALADLMAEGANTYLKDVPVQRSKMEPLLMTRWSKNAEQVFYKAKGCTEPYDFEGRPILIPWK